MLNLFLLAGVLAFAPTASVHCTPAFQIKPFVPEDLDAALTPQHDGIRYAQPVPHARSSSSTTTTTTTDEKPRRARAAGDRFRPTQNQAPIHAHGGLRTGGGGSPGSAAAALGRLKRRHGARGYENITQTAAYGTQYGVAVTFNGQRLVLALDTGSADTWAVAAGANCTSTSTSTRGGGGGGCAFGPAYAGGFLAPGRPLEGVHLYVEYGDGEVARGPLGPVDVGLAGLRVRNQTVGLADDARWAGNNVTSGVLGLAYPGVTSAYGGRPGDRAPYLARPYAPVFASMVDQGLADDFFSVALGRGAADGVLAFGGVPGDLEGVDFDNVAMTDIIIANVADNLNTASDYSFYTIIPDDIAAAINGAFRPPAEYSFFGGYFTTCDAVPPRVAVSVGGVLFWLAPEDLILRGARDPLSGLCVTTVGDGGAGPFVLGDVFLRNVLAVFDVDDAVMQFAGRRHPLEA